jgi:hypothetical protein
MLAVTFDMYLRISGIGYESARFIPLPYQGPSFHRF